VAAGSGGTDGHDVVPCVDEERVLVRPFGMATVVPSSVSVSAASSPKRGVRVLSYKRSLPEGEQRKPSQSTGLLKVPFRAHT
jgi:hypothetical protein